jgi:hypothetical protein
MIRVSPAAREWGHEDAVWQLESAGLERREEFHGVVEIESNE